MIRHVLYADVRGGRLSFLGRVAVTVVIGDLPVSNHGRERQRVASLARNCLHGNDDGLALLSAKADRARDHRVRFRADICYLFSLDGLFYALMVALVGCNASGKRQ